jgi:hypothetical protein
MFLKTSCNTSAMTSTADHFICGGETASGDAAGMCNTHPTFVPAPPPPPPPTQQQQQQPGSAIISTGLLPNAQAAFLNTAVTTNTPEPTSLLHHQQQHRSGSGSDSADNSAASLWRVPSRVTSPFEMPPASATEALHAAADPITAPPPGVLWIGGVAPSRVRELSPFLNSLKSIRSTSVDAGSGQSQRNLDFTFFLDGPSEGQGFLCFYTQNDAEEVARMFPSAVKVGQQEPLMCLSIRLSSVEEMTMAKQCYRYHTKRSTPTTAPHTPPKQDNLVYWLRGLPFQTQRSDVVNFLKNIRYLRLDIGVLESGECSGNAFVELDGTACQEEIENLHNTFIPCAAHANVPALARPKPRFVEVILTSADRRTEQLNIDRSMIRNHLPHHPRVRVPATKTPSSSSSLSATRRVHQRTLHQQRQQHPPLSSRQFSSHELSQAVVDRDSLMPTSSYAPVAAPQVASPYFLVHASQQVITVMPNAAPNPSRLTSPTQLLSPTKVVSVMTPQQQQQQQQQQHHQRPQLMCGTPPFLAGNMTQTFELPYESMPSSPPCPPSAPLSQPGVQAVPPPVNEPARYGANYYGFPSTRGPFWVQGSEGVYLQPITKIMQRGRG